ncbi:hypothetical protein KA013_04385 [Patescibacteria group bacterium]|nr:hypothetical protein [Patescibacteria group bacterium]
MKTLFKLVLVATAIGVTLVLVTSEKSVEALTDDQKKVAEKLEQVGYHNIRFGAKVPSSDGAFVMRFCANDDKGQQVERTVVLWKDEIRVYEV